MTDSLLQDPRAASLALVNGLISRGRDLHERSTQNSQNTQSPALSASSARSALDVRHAKIRIWQHDCAAAINELSGGSKAHWLSRAFSNALLVRSADGAAVVEASAAEIVGRMLEVLEQARGSLADLDQASPAPADAPAPHRFDFVHDVQLRPVLEQAFEESGRALDEGDYERAMKTACGIMEAILTDALEHDARRDARLKPRVPAESDADGARAIPSFDDRIAAAEAAGLIRGGCARLPAVARAYRDSHPAPAIFERDARIARQVLRVVMRDLDPGR